MSDIQSQLAQLTTTPGHLSERTQQAVQYRESRNRNEISEQEYQDLLSDLARLDDIELSAAELQNQIIFNQVLDLLKKLPIP